MTTLPLVIAPDPLLKEVSKPVEKVDDALRQFMKDMVDTMYAEHGVGLAAVQVGQLKRILVMDVDYKIEHDDCCSDNGCDSNKIEVQNPNPRYLVNPEIIESSKDSSKYKEGCLSFPGASSDVTRPKTVTVKYLDFEGKEQVEKMTGLLATCVQHEIDHLNGITFVDHISRLKRDVILKKMNKLKR